MPVIGLTGGIASGKSTVANLLRAKGATVVDADAIARELVLPGEPALDEIKRRFGDEVMASDGTLDRAALGRLIFSDQTARDDLNAILHPRIFEVIRNRVGQADPAHAVFVEAALLAETYSQAAHWTGMDCLVVVDAPEDRQIARLVARGVPVEDARLRLAAQATRQERLARATHVLDNSGSLEDLQRKVDRLWAELSVPQVPKRAPASEP
ncbi:MAG TPA: dephospho-CoA kinase [Actinomycetota bacterium]|nr:dephospho-CoA kinase [Actinomycetota bacterium]